MEGRGARAIDPLGLRAVFRVPGFTAAPLFFIHASSFLHARCRHVSNRGPADGVSDRLINPAFLRSLGPIKRQAPVTRSVLATLVLLRNFVDPPPGTVRSGERAAWRIVR